MAESWNEWARGHDIPAAELTTDPAVVDSWDTSRTRNPSYYRTASAGALNVINVYAVTRIVNLPKWHVVDETGNVAAHVAYKDGQVYQITVGTKEDTIENNRETARADAKAWQDAWMSSEFSHGGTVYDINAEQERRLSLTDSRARRDGPGFSTGWLAKDGTEKQFGDDAAFGEFVKAAALHVESGNSAYRTAMGAIDAALTTTALSEALQALPAIPGTLSIRSTGPLPTAEMKAQR